METDCQEYGRAPQRQKPKINTATRPGKLELRRSENTGLLYESLPREFRRGVVDRGRFVYGGWVGGGGDKPISVGREKKGACVDENRKLAAIFCLKWAREFAESNASAPTVQLQSIRLR